MSDNVNNPGRKILEGGNLFTLPEDVFRFPSERTSSPKSSSNKDQSVSGMEPIDQLSVPKTWSKEVTEPNFGNTSKSVSFTPPDGGGAALSVYDRGFPIASRDGQSFRDVLSQPAHVLSQGEIQSLGTEILGNVGDKSAFSIGSAETKFVNGMKVLSVEGNWKEGGKKFSGIFVPKDASFSEVQEVYFEAAEPQFSQFKRDASKSMETIKWKKPEQ